MSRNQIIALGMACLSNLATIAATPEVRQKPLLLANYYIWYHNGERKQLPWLGWTRPESKKNAAALAAQREGEPPIASAAHPLVGLYDSADPVVADWHVRLAQAAGIDGFLISWWATHRGHDKSAKSGIFAAAEKHGFKIALLDERAQFHNDFDWYKKTLTQTLEDCKKRSCYLRIDDKPVVYLYQVAAKPTLTPAKFRELKKHVEEKVGPVYWIVNKICHDHAAQRAGEKDKVKSIPAEWLAVDGVDAFAVYGTFSNFRAHRYENLVGKYTHLSQIVHDADKKMLLPVHPGHDNSRFRKNPYVMPRRNGQTLRDFLKAAKDSKADFIMVTSWNEWPETTVIEPADTWEDPYLYLKIIAEFQGKAFTPIPPPANKK